MSKLATSQRARGIGFLWGIDEIGEFYTKEDI